jgi:hypothetical protein
MMGVKPENIRIVINRFSPKLHPANKIEASFNSGFKKTYSALPKIGAVIPNNWDTSVEETYNGEIALDGASQWHNIAKEIADLAGYRYEPSSSNGPNRDGSFFCQALQERRPIRLSSDDLLKAIKRMSEYLDEESIATALRIPVETVRGAGG